MKLKCLCYDHLMSKVHPEEIVHCRGEGFHLVEPTDDKKKPPIDIVLVNLEALKTDCDGTQIIPTTEAPSQHPDIPPATVWGTEMQMFTAKQNTREHERLMAKDSGSSNSDYENGILSDYKKKLISNPENEDSIEIQSLSSLEGEGPSFQTSSLVISEYKPPITLTSEDSGELDNIVTNSYTMETLALESVSSNPCNIEDCNPDGESNIEDFNPDEGSNIEDHNSDGGSNYEASVLTLNNKNRIESESSLTNSLQDDSIELGETSHLRGESPAKEMTHLLSSPDNDFQAPSQAYDAELDDQDNNSDTLSTTSEFRGSLGIDVDAGTWICNVEVNLDIRLGRDEWITKLLEAEGDTTQGSWDTTILEIEDSCDQPKDWEISLQDISHHDREEDRDNWKTTIPELFEHNNTPEDWSTTLNKIDKIDQSRNTWSTVFNKIKEHIARKKEWKTKFNPIANNKKNKNEWTFKLPSKMTNEAHKNDWKTKINKLGDVTSATDQWQYKDNEMLVMSDDRDTHWNTAFKNIEKRNLELEKWTTTMNEIAPVIDDDTWAFRFAEMQDDIGNAEDWNIKFIDIEKISENENPWTIKMNDVPNSYKEEEDWMTKFKNIEELDPLMNPWSSKFNNIIENGDETHLWTNKFLSPDLTDMNRETWTTAFNDILPNENQDLDWEVNVNPIESAE